MNSRQLNLISRIEGSRYSACCVPPSDPPPLTHSSPRSPGRACTCSSQSAPSACLSSRYCLKRLPRPRSSPQRQAAPAAPAPSRPGNPARRAVRSPAVARAPRCNEADGARGRAPPQSQAGLQWVLGLAWLAHLVEGTVQRPPGPRASHCDSLQSGRKWDSLQGGRKWKKVSMCMRGARR